MIKRLNKIMIFLIVLTCFMIFNFSNLNAAKPSGGNYTFVNSTTATPSDPQAHAAIAGNVTELNIQGFSTTQSWQGYFGNVSGTIELADSGDNIFYNWSLASPRGEIYASTNDSLLWTNIQCFNFSASGTYASDSSNRGATSQFGTNLTQLETLFNINISDVDGVNETFSLNTTQEAHDKFYTNSLEFNSGECASTFIYDNSGAGVDDKFEEVLLYEPDTRSVVFTALLEEDVLGYDGRSHDFQMLVLEDGHGVDVDTTNYYFYVELQ
jgi:hypothetical protein